MILSWIHKQTATPKHINEDTLDMKNMWFYYYTNIVNYGDLSVGVVKVSITEACKICQNEHDVQISPLI